MSTDHLALLVERSMNDPEFVLRAQTDLEGTLAAEGISLDPDEMTAVREFQTEFAGLSEEEIQSRLTEAGRKQGVM